MKFKFGKPPASLTYAQQPLKLEKYLDHLVLPHPDRVDWTLARTTDCGMRGNDKWGDCAWAMAANAIQTWSANVNGEINLPDSVVLGAYAACTGFAYTDATDNGTPMPQLMSYMAATGMGGYKFGPFVAVNPNNRLELSTAIYLFGGILIGTELPSNWQDDDVWGISTSEIEGGHAIWGAKIDSISGVTIDTWNTTKLFTFPAIAKYCDEIYVTVPPLWLDEDGACPNGFNKAALLADLKELPPVTPQG